MPLQNKLPRASDNLGFDWQSANDANLWENPSDALKNKTKGACILAVKKVGGLERFPTEIEKSSIIVARWVRYHIKAVFSIDSEESEKQFCEGVVRDLWYNTIVALKKTDGTYEAI